jgi:CRP-like cAMP-binding protein
MKPVVEFLHGIHPLPEGLKMHLFERLASQTIQKRFKLLKPGHISERIYFVEKGLFRCYVKRGDKEICKWFMREGDIVISVNSFFNQVRSTETIESLEECTVHSITHAELEETYRLYPEFRGVGQKVTERYYCLSEVRADDLRMKPAEELYDDWVRQYPELVDRVPGNDLASYLGVSFQTLWRIQRMRKHNI